MIKLKKYNVLISNLIIGDGFLNKRLNAKFIAENSLQLWIKF